MNKKERDPLLPRPVVIGIAIVVSAVWAATAIAAIFNPGQAGTLMAVSSLMAMVLGASLGISGNLFAKRSIDQNGTEKSGSENP
jgi:hypothetical protein